MRKKIHKLQAAAVFLVLLTGDCMRSGFVSWELGPDAGDAGALGSYGRCCAR